MQFFADTAEIEDIKKLHEMGLLDGITTNPSLIAKSGRQFKEVIKEICSRRAGAGIRRGRLDRLRQMMAEAHVLAKLADNVVVKVPLTVDGLRACKMLHGEGIKINVTLCFSPNQALLAAKCGATYISPFIGRLDDINIEGMDLIRPDPHHLRQLQFRNRNSRGLHPHAQPRDPGCACGRRCRDDPASCDLASSPITRSPSRASTPSSKIGRQRVSRSSDGGR